MRLTNDKVFPRPILKDEMEDFKTTFSVNFKEPDNRTKSIGIGYKYECGSSIFNELISAGKVGIYLHMYSSNNMFRECIDISYEQEDFIEFDKKKLFGSCDISVVMCAKEDLVINGANELIDSSDNFYQVLKGQIIAFAPTVELELDLSKNTLNDFVHVCHTKNPENYNMISLRNESGVIYYLSEEEYKAYADLYNSNDKLAKTLSLIIHQNIYNRLFLELNNEDSDVVMDKCIQLLLFQFARLYPDKDIYAVNPSEYGKYSYEMSNLSFKDMQESIRR